MEKPTISSFGQTVVFIRQKIKRGVAVPREAGTAVSTWKATRGQRKIKSCAASLGPAGVSQQQPSAAIQ